MKPRNLRFPAVLAAVLLLTAACAERPWKASERFAAQKPAIKRIVVMEPLVSVVEIGAGFRLAEVPEWSKLGVETMRAALLREASAAGFTPVPQNPTDPEGEALLDLFSVVDYSAKCHAYEISMEHFPDRIEKLDYTLGGMEEFLARHSADAALFTGGVSLVPTTGAAVQEGVFVAVSMLAAMSGGPVAGPLLLPRIILDAALVGKDGILLYHSSHTRLDLGVTVDEKGDTPDERPASDIRSSRYARLAAASVFKRYREAE